MNNKPHLDNEKLREVRDNADWRKLFDVLGLKRDEKRSTPDDWWAVSPFTNEREPSFHINDKGFFCFSTNESGGVIELVQAILKTRGQIIDCYDAGRWLLEQGVSSLRERPMKTTRSERKMEAVAKLKEKIENIPAFENKPIRQDLRYALTCDHPEFEQRGISEKALKYLGAGFMSADKTRTSGLKDRFVFQVRGVKRSETGELSETVLTHIARASTEEQEKGDHGKWWIYRGFHKSLELYNIDKLLLDPEAVEQAREKGSVVIVEGAFDVAKLVEAGILNCVSTLGSHLSDEQLSKLRFVSEELGKEVNFLVFYDRDRAGKEGAVQAVELLKQDGLSVQAFDWDVTFSSEARAEIKIPEKIKDACEMSVEQLKFLRKRGFI